MIINNFYVQQEEIQGYVCGICGKWVGNWYHECSQ